MVNELHRSTDGTLQLDRAAGGDGALELTRAAATSKAARQHDAEALGSGVRSARRYLAIFAATFAAISAGAWTWANFGKMWFLDVEYTTWQAKLTMVRNCTLGETAVVGDSQVMAGMVPDLIGENVVNLAVGGGSPIETAFLVRHMLQCPSLPRRVLVAYSPGTWVWAEFYWTRAVFFDYFSLDEMEEVRQVSERLEDAQLYPQKSFQSVRGYIKNLSYELDAPFHYSAAMRNAWLFTRRRNNMTELAKTIRARGHRYCGTLPAAPWPGPIGSLESFEVGRLQDYYFSNMVSMLEKKGIDVYYVTMPESELTANKMRPRVRSEFSAYLKGLVKRHGNLHVLVEPFPILPVEYFGDSEHLNEKGARMWSKTVGRRLTEIEESKLKSREARPGAGVGEVRPGG